MHRLVDSRKIMHAGEVEQAFGLKPLFCPFCGTSGDNVGLYLGPTPHMTCTQCGTDGPIEEPLRDDMRSKQYRAILAWNRRVRRLP